VAASTGPSHQAKYTASLSAVRNTSACRGERDRDTLFILWASLPQCAELSSLFLSPILLSLTLLSSLIAEIVAERRGRMRCHSPTLKAWGSQLTGREERKGECLS
jgi:hypothetical protein